MIQTPEVPVAVLKIHSYVATDTDGFGVSALLQELVDARVFEDSIGIHADEVRDVVDLGVGQERSHLGEEGRAEDRLRPFVPGIILIEEGAEDDETIALALVLVLDNAKIGRAFVGSALDSDVHGLLVPRGVGILDDFPLLNVRCENILEEVLGRALFHAGSSHSSITDDHDRLLVVVDLGLCHERVEGLSALLQSLIVAGQEQHQRLRLRRSDDLLRENSVLNGKEYVGEDHDAVQRHG